MLFTQLVKANLESQILGREIEYYTALDSTNSEAMELLKQGTGEGTVVITDNQTAGRGRHGTSWFSGPGKGLTFSVILKPDMGGASAGLVSLVAGLSLAEALERLQLEPRLKWPNDILLSGKKCGGVLVETKFQGDVMRSAIVGVGVNVNEAESEFPESIRDMATSIAEVKQSPVQRELLLAWILTVLERRYGELRSGDTDSIVSAWENRCCHLQKHVIFDLKGKETEGVFEGVSQGGEAIIRTADDSKKLTLSSHEISDIRET